MKRYLIGLIVTIIIAISFLFCLNIGQADIVVSDEKIAFESSSLGSTNPATDEIYIMNPDGTEIQRLTSNDNYDGVPSWSPNGERIVFESWRDGNHEIYSMNADGSNQTNLTNDNSSDKAPAWSPDGTKIAFYSNRSGKYEIYTMAPDGSGVFRLTYNGGNYEPAWSPDGSKIVYESNGDIYVIDTFGNNQLRLTSNPSRDGWPAWSPDGTKIVFVSLRDGNAEIYLMNADGTEQVNLTQSTANDWFPAWSPDGTSIIFESSRDGNYELYQMNLDGTKQTRFTINKGNDEAPVWFGMVQTVTPSPTPTQTPDISPTPTSTPTDNPTPTPTPTDIPTPTPTEAPVIYSVSGRVTSADGITGISNVTIAFSGGFSSVQTDSSGYWIKEGLSGTVTITPSRYGCVFDVSSREVTNESSNINFIVTSYNDDFTNIDSGWYTGSSSGGTSNYRYQNGAYEIEIIHPKSQTHTRSPIGVSGDYTVEAKIWTATSTDVYNYGLTFNSTGLNYMYYYFAVNPVTKKYAVFKYDWSNGSTNLSPVVGWSTFNGIQNTNILKIHQIGSQVTLYINNTEVRTISLALAANAGLKVGVFAKNYSQTEQTPLIIRYDDFVLTSASYNPVIPTPSPTPTPIPGTYSVSGRVYYPDGITGVPGVTISFDGSSSVTTDSSGYWTKSGLSGTVNIYASKNNHTFSQGFRTVTEETSGINFRVNGITDDFSDPDSGWFVGDSSSGNGSFSYVDGEYEILLRVPNAKTANSSPIRLSNNYQVQTKVRASTPVDSYEYGFEFNYSSSSLIVYSFLINPVTKTYSVIKEDNTAGYAIRDYIVFSKNCNYITSQCYLKIEQLSNEITLLINGYPVESFSLPVPSGSLRTGFIVRNNSTTQAPLAIRFDDFNILDLEGLPTPTPTPTPIMENFDGMTAGQTLPEGTEWDYDNDAYTPIIISNDQALSAPNSLKFFDDASSNKAAIVRRLFGSAQPQGIFKCSLYIPSGNSEDFSFMLTNGGGNENRYIDIFSNKSGNIFRRYLDGSTGSLASVQLGTTINLNHWNTIEISWDATNRYTVKVNNTSFGPFDTIYNNITPTMLLMKAGKTSIYSGYSTTVYVDDLSIRFN